MPQAQQRFQDLDLGLVDALDFDSLQQGIAIVLAQFVVELALGRLHLAVNGLLGFRGQLASDLFLGPAQDERPQRAGQKAAGFFVGSTSHAGRQFEDARGA